MRFKNILFVADREDGLDAALDRAVAVSQNNGARLTVMDVTHDAGLNSYLRRTCAIDLDARLREQRLESLEAPPNLIRMPAYPFTPRWPPVRFSSK